MPFMSMYHACNCWRGCSTNCLQTLRCFVVEEMRLFEQSLTQLNPGLGVNNVN